MDAYARTGGRVADGARAVPGERRRHGVIAGIVLGLVLLISVCMMAHDPVSQWLHAFRAAQTIDSYDRAVAALSETERADMLAAARSYNAALPEGAHYFLSDNELAEYAALLDPAGTGMMGYIEIPKIGVRLPIRHDASEEVLETAVGHIPGSSLPVGGEGSHAVLCGHRDLSTARLFRDLGELTEGDTFTVTVLGEAATYQVDQIQVVLPEEIGSLAIEAGADRCTLVTCHPYGSDSHRLLVRGSRVGL